MNQSLSEHHHRREVWRAIVLPMALAVLFMLALIGVAIALLSPVQFSIVADMMAILFILVPYMILCLIPTLLLVAGAVGLWAVHSRVARPVRRGRRVAVSSLAKATPYITQAGKPLVAIQSRLAFVEQLLSGRRARVSSEEETKQ
ncbi:MAG: hypothetical protein JXN59_04670 [Anaerolineae bacterium]|nr:hypothetical protein [Anaerolineae bacterium]